VIDVGCGDLNFWKYEDCNKYTGIDISPVRIERNRILKPNWNFICADASVDQSISAEVVFCFDILFHIMDDVSYDKILTNLMQYSTKYIFIYTWSVNPFSPRDTDGIYQKYRDFNLYPHTFEEAGFKLIDVEKSPYLIDKFGSMWIFKQVDE
jgi:hypothetical protein